MTLPLPTAADTNARERVRASARPVAETAEQRRRRSPRLWDTDWLVLKGMHKAIDAFAERLVKSSTMVLDFGAGEKPYERLFTSRGATYLAADFAGDAGAAHQYPVTAEGRLFAPSSMADVVVSFQVLEHVRDLDMYFAEARRVLRDDGLLLLSTHGTWLYHPHPEDHRRWTREGLIGDIEARGFEVIDCVPVVGPLGWTTMLRLTCFRYALIKVPVAGAPLAAMLGVVMNLKAAMEDAVTPAWVTKDNACVYVTLSRPKADAARGPTSP